jgi:predicted negative regulator of RcsB-dependent stress response
MSVYQTEEEQVEAIKRWWKENSTSVITGLILGLSAVFGWQGWTSYQNRTGSQASVAFSQMVGAIEGGNSTSAVKQAEIIIDKYEGSHYSVFAAMATARLKLESGDRAGATSSLEWVIQQADEPALRHLAQLNLARIKLDEGALDEAEKLASTQAGEFMGEFTVLKGDIALAKGDRTAAIEAYTLAMAQEKDYRPLLQMKLDDLAVTQP